MKGYVVTLMNIEQSKKTAARCIESGQRFNVNIEMYPAVYKDNAEEEMKKEGLKIGQFDDSFSNIWAVVGNFVTQYRIWKQSIENNEELIVLEHDAIFVDYIPEYIKQGNIVNIGKPSYGKYNVKNTSGIYPLFSKNGGYFPGAHGYFITPEGAKQLVNKAKEIGIFPCDVFLHKNNFPKLKEIYPWVVVADDSFTTIQKEKGCIAKHNYNDGYEIL